MIGDIFQNKKCNNMTKIEAEDFQFEVDAWIKSFKKDIDLFSSELDGCNDEIGNHREELQFHFENICKLENKVDHMEELMEKILLNMELRDSINRIEKKRSLQPLKEKRL